MLREMGNGGAVGACKHVSSEHVCVRAGRGGSIWAYEDVLRARGERGERARLRLARILRYDGEFSPVFHAIVQFVLYIL